MFIDFDSRKLSYVCTAHYIRARRLYTLISKNQSVSCDYPAGGISTVWICIGKAYPIGHFWRMLFSTNCLHFLRTWKYIYTYLSVHMYVDMYASLCIKISHYYILKAAMMNVLCGQCGNEILLYPHLHKQLHNYNMLLPVNLQEL
jgi:hypothetical protein